MIMEDPRIDRDGSKLSIQFPAPELYFHGLFYSKPTPLILMVEFFRSS